MVQRYKIQCKYKTHRNQVALTGIRTTDHWIILNTTTSYVGEGNCCVSWFIQNGVNLHRRSGKLDRSKNLWFESQSRQLDCRFLYTQDKVFISAL
jgi:hypothetical protein